jgi:hypothetical protein
MARPAFKPAVPDDRGPPPKPEDYPGDEYALLLADLVWRHGGLSKFGAVQREIAGQVAQLMIDMRSAGPGELVRHADVMSKLMAQLPDQPPPPAVSEDDEASIAELEQQYVAMLRKVDWDVNLKCGEAQVRAVCARLVELAQDGTAGALSLIDRLIAGLAGPEAERGVPGPPAGVPLRGDDMGDAPIAGEIVLVPVPEPAAPTVVPLRRPIDADPRLAAFSIMHRPYGGDAA